MTKVSTLLDEARLAAILARLDRLDGKGFSADVGENDDEDTEDLEQLWRDARDLLSHAATLEALLGDSDHYSAGLERGKREGAEWMRDKAVKHLRMMANDQREYSTTVGNIDTSEQIHDESQGMFNAAHAVAALPVAPESPRVPEGKP